MFSQATTTIDIWRDTDTSDTDAYGDGTETGGAPLRAGVPVSLIEQERRLYGQPSPHGGEGGEESGDMRIVKFIVARGPNDLDVVIGDRVQDTADGEWYSVADVVRPKNSVIALDVRMNLRKLA